MRPIGADPGDAFSYEDWMNDRATDDSRPSRGWNAAHQLRCRSCGKFHKGGTGSAWKMVYSGYPPSPDEEITRCVSCVEKLGPFDPQSGIKPEFSCGIFE